MNGSENGLIREQIYHALLIYLLFKGLGEQEPEVGVVIEAIHADFVLFRVEVHQLVDQTWSHLQFA